MSSSYRQELDKWLKTIDVDAHRVLDIGGSQLPIKGRTKSWNVKEYLIADLPNPHIDSPKPDIEIDMNVQMSTAEAFAQASDVIFCLEVAEYIWNPVAMFHNLANLKGYSGTVYASFPFAYPTHNPVEHDCLRYTEQGIRKLAQEAGLVVVDITPRRPETNALLMFYGAERMRPAKGYDHNVTGWMVTMR